MSERILLSFCLSLLPFARTSIFLPLVTIVISPEDVSTRSFASAIACSSLVFPPSSSNCILPDTSIRIIVDLAEPDIPLLIAGDIAENIRKRRASISKNIRIFFISFLENVVLFSLRSAFFHNKTEGTTLRVPFGFIRYKIIIIGTPTNRTSGRRLANVISHSYKNSSFISSNIILFRLSPVEHRI